MRTQTLIVSMFLLGTACDHGDPDRTARAGEVEVPQAETAQAETPQAAVTPESPPSLSREELHALQPTVTRAGFPRFSTAAVNDPIVADVFLLRLEEGQESPEIRAALVAALPRTGGEFATRLVALLSSESDTKVRVSMMAAFERAPMAAAHQGLRAGLGDAQPQVRAQAATSFAERSDATALLDDVIALMADADPQVRAAAIRSVGLVADESHAQDVAQGLGDPDAKVRLEAVRALRRIDKDGVAARVKFLLTDEDDTVRLAAQRLQP